MRLAAIILLFISINTFAQVNGDWIESGQLKLRVNADGEMAKFNNSAASELPAGSNNNLFKFINLWISGNDDSNKLHITSVNGFTNKSDYSPGPIDSLNYKGADPLVWNKVWSVSAVQIQEHRKNFQNTNYIVSDAIKNWPSNGTERFNKYLAPFIDFDKDGKYDPTKGDYPEIIGTKASYFIVNDNYSEHKASSGQPLKIEIYGLAYTLADAPNTVFAKYFIINRTSTNYKDINVSFHAGFQLGNDKDNYCGTIVPKNMIFSYNGDANDDNHFGTTQPLASLMILNKKLSSTLYITNDTAINSGMPIAPNQHRNMMLGNWKTAKLLTFGSDGMSNTSQSKFVYSGNTDPDFNGQTWKENTAAGERSMLANMSYPTLVSKEYIELDIAISGYDKSNGDPYIFLANKADEIKNNWARQILNTSKKLKSLEFTLKNPALSNENIYQNWMSGFEELSISNQFGQLVRELNTKVNNTLIMENKGIYYFTFKSENQIITKKILIF